MKILDWMKGKRTWYLYAPNGWRVRDAIFVAEIYGTEEEARKTGLLYSQVKMTPTKTDKQDV